METSDILTRAYSAWNACGELRTRRQRCKRFTYGDQWSDLVRNPDGHYVTEYDAAIKSGKKVYTNNLIRQLVKTVVGRYRTEATENGLYSGEIAAISVANSLPELDARTLEEFLISGCAIHRVVDERRWNGEGIWVDAVDPRRFFVNAFSDPRGWDIELVGMLHDMTLPEMVNRFGGGNPERAAMLSRAFGTTNGEPTLSSHCNSDSFFTSADSGKCRVIEVWTFDSRPCCESSPDSAFCWHCRYFAPDGTLLSEFDSPYAHGGHPFAVKFYPLTDGEVHPFVEDVLDQQKYINRLIVMLDHILACSAKGVLLFPMGQLPAGIDLDRVADAWSSPDGVIPITGHGNCLPQQVSTYTGSPGAYQLLELQMKLFEQVSGVGSALMGRSSNARGANMLDSEVRNASIALADLFQTFTSFTTQRNRLALCARA